MKKIIKEKLLVKRILAWTLCVLFTIYGSVVFAEKQELKLMIELGKTKVALGEPVYLTAKLENTGSKAIPVFPSLYPEDSALQLEITSPTGKRVGFAPYSLDLNDIALKDLVKGKSITAAFPIFYGGRGWTFQEAGNYQISATFVNPANGAPLTKSASVELTVFSENGAGRFLLKDGKASDEAGKFLLWQSGDHLRAGIAHLESLVEQYPISVLVEYARLAFAHNLSRPFRDYSIGKLRKPNPKAALKILKKVNFNRLPPYLQIDLIVSQSRSEVLLGNNTKAKSVLQRADSIVEKQPALRPLLDQAGIEK